MNNDNKFVGGIEESFHDKKYMGKIDRPRHYSLNPTSYIFGDMKNMLGDIRGKRILEYGCGDGWITAELVGLGSNVDAFDISGEAITRTSAFLKKNNLYKNCNLKKMTAEELYYEDELFDIAFGFAILHHLDLDKAIPELLRVVKKGGKVLFAEPLGTNMLINIYRKITPQYRTPTEKPLNFIEFDNYASMFHSYSHREYYLTALFPLTLSYINKNISNVMLPYFIKIDNIIMSKYPKIGRYAWYTVIEMIK